MLTTAFRVNESVRKQINELISDIFKTKVELEEVVDGDIIGGFISGLMTTISMPASGIN